MSALPPKYFRAAAHAGRRGFSLVVSLVMMAMMLLVAISLVTFVVLESNLTVYKTKQYMAEANAICGLRIAIGQLQRLTGDDQRVTATADILGSGGSSNASLPSGSPYRGKRYWTGVWATGGLDKSDSTKIRDWDYNTPDEKPFLGWLVSGYDSTNETYSPYELPVSKSSAQSGQGTSTLQVVTSAYDVDDSSPELITLVGAGTLGKKTGWEDKTVKVRRVPLEKRTNFQKSAKDSGSFAYWVGDEGVKARVNIADAYANVEGTETTGMSDWFRMMRAAPQRVGVEAITGYGDFESWWKSDLSSAGKASATRLPYVLSAGGMSQYADDDSSSFVESAKDLYHDVSFFSRGVFSDVYNGGLRTDLSVAFEMPWFDGEDGWDKGFRSYPQFHGSGEKNQLSLLSRYGIASTALTKWWITQPSDGLGYVYEIQTGVSGTMQWGYGNDNPTYSKSLSILRGPTWDVYRNYYRLYKRETEELGYRGLKPQQNNSWLAVGIAPYTYTEGIFNTNSANGYTGVFGPKGSFAYMGSRSSDSDNVRRFVTPMIDGDKLVIPQSMRIAPVILRSIMRFSLIFNQDTQALIYDPMMVVWNPYNVPIEIFGIGSYFTKYYPISFTLDRADGGTWKYNQIYKSGTQSGTSMPVDMFYYSSNSFMVTANAFRWFAGTTNLNTAPRGSITLWPGEIRAVFPQNATEPKTSGLVASIGDTTYAEYSNAGFELPFAYSSDDEKQEALDGVTFTVSVRAVNVDGAGAKEQDMQHFYLFYPVGAEGQSLNTTNALTRSWLTTSVGDVADSSDENYIQGFSVPRITLIPVSTTWSNYNGVTFYQTSDSGYDHAQKQPIAYIDLYRATAEQTALASPILTNARPWLCTASNWDDSNASISNGSSSNHYDTMGVGWVAELKPAQSSFSPIENVNGSAFWGDSNTSSNGQSNIVLFEVPQRPMHSIGQFQSVDSSIAESEGSYVVGNSYAPLGLNDNTKFFYWPRQSSKTQPIADHSFAANLALFDRYFFSGINYGSQDDQKTSIDRFLTTLLGGSENPLADKRVAFVRDRSDSTQTDDVVKTNLMNPNKSARYFLYEGMFNVNSTSVEAWKAILGSLHGQYLSIDGSYSKVSDFPIVRFAAIIGRRAGGNSARNVADSGGDEGEGWRWYRSLKDSEIESLAKQIVEEVRLRGPFMSMADFVNRRISSNSDYSRRGALQAAIDKVSNLNRSMRISTNTPSSDYTNLVPDPGSAYSKAGAPGYLTQGDILSCLGAGMAVRSDTFTIRAYGDVFGLSGTPQARAYCEAVVQRTPEWVATEDDSTLYSSDNSTFDALKFKQSYRSKQETGSDFYEKFERNTALKAVNRLLGRKYKIVSFRWLSADEI